MSRNPSQRKISNSDSKARLTIQKTLDMYAQQFQPGYNRLYENRQTNRSASPAAHNYFRGIYPTWAEFNDGQYQGALDLQRKPDGPGVFQSDQGYFYVGEWNQSIIHGKGFMVLPKGHYFYGQFRSGRVHGNGIMGYPSGVLLFGFWNSSRLHGLASFYHMKNSSWILADFHQGKLMKYVKEERVDSPLQLPTTFSLHREHKEQLQDFIDSRILRNVEQFQIETQKSCFSKIKCHQLEPHTMYLGFIMNDSNNLTGLGTLIKDWNVPFYGQLKNATLNGLGTFFLNDDSYYLGHFKEGKFQGVGCLVTDRQWRSGRWNGSDLVIPDDNSGQGSSSLWIQRYLNELHIRSNKHVDQTIGIEKLVAPAFEQLYLYDHLVSQVEAFKPNIEKTRAPSQTVQSRNDSIPEVSKQSTPIQAPAPTSRVSVAIDMGQSIFRNKQPLQTIETKDKEVSQNKKEDDREQSPKKEKQTPIFTPSKPDTLVTSPLSNHEQEHSKNKLFTPVKNFFENDKPLDQPRSKSSAKKRIFQPVSKTDAKFLYSESEYKFIFQQ